MKATREELLEAIIEHIAVIKKEQWMKKNYSTGTCNAEDAWKDFGERKSASEKELKRLAKCK